MRPPKPTFRVKGVLYDIPWDKVEIGDSFFIPCLDVPEVIIAVRTKTARRRWHLTYEARIEAGKWGVRFWRTL